MKRQWTREPNTIPTTTTHLIEDPVGTILIDEERHLIAMDPRAEALTGWSVDDAIGHQHCYDLFRCRDAMGMPVNGNCPAQHAFRKGCNQQACYSVTRKDGAVVRVCSRYHVLPFTGRRAAIIRMELAPVDETAEPAREG